MSHDRTIKRTGNEGFTLIELLVVIAVISMLMAVMLPALGAVKQKAKGLVCMSKLKQMGIAFWAYAADNNDYSIPTYDPDDNTYWWGQIKSDGIDHKAGFLYPYMQSSLEEGGIYECPSQPFGSYELQAKPADESVSPDWITSTYGYNGYYLAPPSSPWQNIHDKPWQRLAGVSNSGKVIAFADSMLDWNIRPDQAELSNNAMIDPPMILSADKTGWQKNPCPTTSFRHDDRTSVVFVDGHCETKPVEDGQYTSPSAKIGSITATNGPYYVPDYESWPTGERRRRRAAN
ncbi:type II secretion system protein G [Anaerohalosphaera lusitana]|uniref:Type II secretion system protein G n=1 Tax=Anaerohalosphaera lusitana TaxID=1936003 RepID=A0A1U9NKW1_9BACT|nr:type II secretion system protein [Anaerohalosphaera lusitana]AQT68549.1 type II secretion system protein G [Anaerohalosphaera lusitana]